MPFSTTKPEISKPKNDNLSIRPQSAQNKTTNNEVNQTKPSSPNNNRKPLYEPRSPIAKRRLPTPK